jgi:hypothetical protein
MYFITLLDKNYISRASVMIETLFSFKQKCNYELFILCLDVETEIFFKNKDNINTINLQLFESNFNELTKIKHNRTYIEYIFTISPFLPLYIFKNFNHIDRITSIDADLYFLNDPFDIINELGNEYIGITAHNFNESNIHLEVYGKFNVSFQSFPRNINAIKCLKSWANSCIDYCSDILDNKGRYADQKYLEEWPYIYNNIKIFPSPSIGLAPWNLPLYDDKNSNIIFYHFHNIRFKSYFHMTSGVHGYGNYYLNKSVKKLYFLYWSKIKRYNSTNDKLISRGSRSNNTLKSIYKDFKENVVFFSIFNVNITLDLRILLKYI